jgi:hypothetical protein
MNKVLCFIFLAVPVLHAEDEPFPPVAIPPERYEKMGQRSPFVLPTATTAEAPAPEWTSDFRIVSVLSLGDESVVLVRKLSTGERVPFRREANALGMKLVELKMASDPRNVSAVIEWNGKEGSISYDDSILSGLPTSVAPGNPALKSE